MAPNNRSKNKNKNKNKKRRPIPLVGRHTAKMTSRKRARKVTTMFHKLTKERDDAISNSRYDEISKCDKLLQEIGGREEYQRASQLSTSYHSTSKWVLGQLKNNGWLYGIKKNEKEKDKDKEEIDNNNNHNIEQQQQQQQDKRQKKKKKKKVMRRNTRLLEVGAINTELLDAAAELKNNNDNDNDNDVISNNKNNNNEKKYKLDVRAIDINSMHPKIEEMDFLKLPLLYLDDNKNNTNRYDVIVCSMVINCVTSPQDRGLMLLKLYNHLRPGGLCFLTLPLFCLTKSAFLTYDIFVQMLSSSSKDNDDDGGGIGFEIVNTKNSPRIAFFTLRRPATMLTTTEDEEKTTGRKVKKIINPIYKKQIIRNKGKKYPNQFSVVLPDDPNETGGGR